MTFPPLVHASWILHAASRHSLKDNAPTDCCFPLVLLWSLLSPTPSCFFFSVFISYQMGIITDRLHSQSSVTQPTNRGRNLEKQTYQILKFRETSPASEPFARTGFGPSTNRKERMIAYISSFDSVYTRGKAAGSCS